MVFQILFGEVGSERITKDLLNTVLDERVDDVQLNENIVLRRDLPGDKMGIVDVLAKINGQEYCNIELQRIDKKDIIKRLLYYWAKQYTKGIKEGEDFKELKRTIAILIADFEIDSMNKLDFHSKWKLTETENRKHILTEDIEIHIIELPKMYKKEARGQDAKLKEWLYFLENPESKEVLSYMENNESMKEAKEKLETMSEDERIRKLAELREKAILDEREIEYTGYCKGKEEGIKTGKLETAKNMKKMGMSLETIIEVTNLTKEDIENL